MKKKRLKVGNKRSGLAEPFAVLLAAIRQIDCANLSMQEMKDRLVASQDNLAEPYAILKEIIRRLTGLTLFDTQLAASHAMQLGRIAELPTGEGKTLSAVVTAATFALQGERVHVLVFNDYLARRDFSANRQIYETCGLSCACVAQRSTPEERKAAYACDVVYASAKEVGFDHLRDFLCEDPDQLLLRTFPVALVDEADSILIDEARIPLVLAGNRDVSVTAAENISRAIAALSSGDVSVNFSDNQVWLTDSGIEAIQMALRIGNLFVAESAEILAQINAALEARHLVQKDKAYIVKDGAVLLVDEATGRVSENRRFPDLLQQAVEVKEHVAQAAQTVIYNSMSMQAFLNGYDKLCGMTGTAASSGEAFRQMYGLEVEVVPPHTPCIRIDHEDAVFPNASAQMTALLDCIRMAHGKGQPILVGTQSVEESEALSQLLRQHQLPHHILNARNDEQEAAVIQEAGRPCQITISTNMAGRGVDIRLGGSDEQEAETAGKAGGLYVMSTGLNRSLRVDNQLRGRAGRQGDPGESRFFVNLADMGREAGAIPNMGSTREAGSTPHAGITQEDGTNSLVAKMLRRAQRDQERKDTEARYMLDRYSSLLEEKRRDITAYHTDLLFGRKTPSIMQTQAPELLEALLRAHGQEAVTRAEKQLTLYFINRHWADYLTAVEDKRSGIHLEVVGGKSPLDEYSRFVIGAYQEMQQDIRLDVVDWMQRCHITDTGIDMAAEGLSGATTTWTYLINDSADQFSRIPYLIRTVSNAIRGTLFSVRDLSEKVKHRLSRTHK